MAASGRIGGGCTIEFDIKGNPNNTVEATQNKGRTMGKAFDGGKNPNTKKKVTFRFPFPITVNNKDELTVELSQDQAILFEWPN